VRRPMTAIPTAPSRSTPPGRRPRSWLGVLLIVLMTALVPGMASAAEPTSRPIEVRTPTPTPGPTPTPSPSPSPSPTSSPSPSPSPFPAAEPDTAADTTAIATASTRPIERRYPAPTATPAWTGPTTLGSTVRFHGRGYGHGVGLNQYGARGRALAGQDATQILAHYYQGATAGSIATETPIRVRILVDFRASAAGPLVLYGRGGPWTIDGVGATFPADAKVTVSPATSGSTTTWRVKVTSPAGAILRDALTGHFRMRPAASGTRIQVWSRPSSFDHYRGVIRAVLDGEDPIANVVNELPLEGYLRGVVPAEMPSSWPPEALRAQSIAARSYAARRLRPGVSYYDVRDDSSSQVYLGIETEKAATDAAIAATAGVVLKSGSSIANTLFHSAGGGGTEHNENVFVSATGAKVAGPVSYLRGSRDRRPDGSAWDDASPYATWSTDSYPRSTVSAIFGGDSRTNVGSLTALDLRVRGVSGRVISVRLIGSTGTRTVSADVFRSVFNARRPAGSPMLRSTLFDTKPVP
jgi:stage II sporulation protein D